MLYIDEYSLKLLHDDRMEELRSRAATESVVTAMRAQKRWARREAALSASKSAVEAKKDKATVGWQNQRQHFVTGHLRGAK